MLWLLLIACMPSPSGPEAGTLVLLGGPPLSDGVTAFAEAAGGEGASVLFVPTAAAEGRFDDLTVSDELESLGLTVQWHHTRSPAQADDDAFCTPLQQVDGVWFAGGSTQRLVDTFAHTRFADGVVALAHAGLPVGGSSAGAMFLAEHSLRTDEEAGVLVDEAPGLGLLADTIVDTHWHDKDRVGDMATVLDTRPGLVGLGIDNGASVVIEGTQVQVLGEGQVGLYRDAWTLELYDAPTTFDLRD